MFWLGLLLGTFLGGTAVAIVQSRIALNAKAHVDPAWEPSGDDAETRRRRSA